jgi:hypothetical protein
MALDEPSLMGWQDGLFYDSYELSPSSHRVIFVLLHEPDGLDDIHKQQGAHNPFRIVRGNGEIVLKHLPRRLFGRAHPIFGHGPVDSRAEQFQLRQKRDSPTEDFD